MNENKEAGTHKSRREAGRLSGPEKRVCVGVVGRRTAETSDGNILLGAYNQGAGRD